MTAISSFRPLIDSEEVAENQIRAKVSWERVFDTILLVGPDEFLLRSAKTHFITGEDFPTISALATIASLCNGWTFLINADIFIGETFVSAVSFAQRKGGTAIMSMRYQFDWATGDEPRIVDHGYDIFGTTGPVWRKIAREIPAHYRIGHSCFDSWLLGFFNENCGAGLVDVTQWRAVFHPKHGDRKRKYHIELVHDRYSM